jgi:hypothetical protein
MKKEKESGDPWQHLTKFVKGGKHMGGCREQKFNRSMAACDRGITCVT